MLSFLQNLPLPGLIVIILTVLVFITALITLFRTVGRYRALQELLSTDSAHASKDPFIRQVRASFETVYRQNGQNTNTPAIIDTASANALHRELLGERFLSNTVSILVTLGLFGTFLGLTLSVSSLSQLIGQSPDGEWLSVLDSVGGGLLSALGGMGVAFGTSLVGVACAIIVTILRTVFNPQAQREKLTNMTELWLDHTVAATIEPEVATDEAMMVKQLKDELRLHAQTVQQSLDTTVTQMGQVLDSTTRALGASIQSTQEPLERFAATVSRFNENVRDFSEFNYNLRTSLERMDLNFLRLAEALRDASSDKGGKRA